MAITKFSSDGELIWAKRVAGGSSGEYPYHLHIDQSDNILIAGQFHGMVDFNPNTPINIQTAEFGFDLFLLKLTSDGNYIWVRKWDWLEWKSMTHDSDGTIYNVGTHFGPTHFDPSDGEFSIGSNQIEFTYLMRLNAGGLFDYAYTSETPDNELNDILFLLPSSLLMTGKMRASGDFNPGPSVTIIGDPGEYYWGDVFVLKCDTAANLEWFTHSHSTESNERGKSIDISPNGEIYVVGSINSDMDADPGNEVFAITSFGETGGLI